MRSSNHPSMLPYNYLPMKSNKFKRVLLFIYRVLDWIYLKFDKRLVRRTKNLRLVPGIAERKGGRRSYGEWCHVIGIFQTLLYLHLNKKEDNRILDIGCGTGFLGVASEPFLGNEGKYTGIDVMDDMIKFCRKHYPKRNFSFQHLTVFNPRYTPEQNSNRGKWAIGDSCIDMVTALSVWTHLNEKDAIFYFQEIDRVLKPGCKAIITFFLLDDMYYNGVSGRTNERGKFHYTRQDRWIFNVPCSESKNWFHPHWADHPEDSIGVTLSGVEMMIEKTSLKLAEIHTGNWKESPGIFFQDILIFEK